MKQEDKQRKRAKTEMEQKITTTQLPFFISQLNFPWEEFCLNEETIIFSFK
jgi:hypothetical protein